MPECGVQKLLVTCVLSVLLTGNHINAAPGYGASKSLIAKDLPPAKWSLNVIKNKVTVSNLNQIEPGFDLNEEEIKKFKLWPLGIISYYIDDLSYDKVLRDRIRTFLDVTGSLTGLHFKELPSPPKDESTRWVFFVNRLGVLGCTDHSILNFTNEGVQKVTLGYNCMSEGGELPEAVLAIIGVPPQHNSPDRDQYVTVQIENIIPEKRYLFQEIDVKEWLFHDLEYDYNSAGHFDFHKHTINGVATIKPKKLIDFPLGEDYGFSHNDIVKINMLYNYISRKKSHNIKAHECNKLFEPSNNFKNFTPDLTDEIPPRPKPNKYLGLPENNTASKESDAKDYNEPEEGNESEINNDNVTKPKTSKDYIDDSIIYRLKRFDPLFNMSDYDTDDMREKVKQNRDKNREKKPNKTRRL